MWLLLIVSVMSPRKDLGDVPDHSFANSVIESQSVQRRRTFAELTRPSADELRPLTREERTVNKSRAFANLMDVVNFLFMPAWGCLHLRSEWYLHSKSNTRPPTSFTSAHGGCDGQCYICNEDYSKVMLPVVYEGALRFLESDHLRSGLVACCPLTFGNLEALTKLLSDFVDY